MAHPISPGTAAVLALAAFVAGSALHTSGPVRAGEAPPAARPGGADQNGEGSEYPYLPRRYGEPYIPSVADWQAVRLSALGSATTRVTRHFSRQHLTCFPGPRGLALTIDLVPEAGWPHYAGGGKFRVPAEQVKPDLEAALVESVKFVRAFFREVRDEHLEIRVYVNSESVGTWSGGKLLLNDE
jgi:hypothetical protein